MTTSPHPSPLVIGHRGACGYEPENTLRSLSKALELGVSWVEFDVRIVEGTPLLFHDRSLKRCAGIDELLEAQTLSYVQSLDVGKSERIPLLDDALDLLENRAGAFVELKGPMCAGPVGALLGKRMGGWWGKETLRATSFDHHQLIELRGITPDIDRVPIMRGNPIDPLDTARALGASLITIDLEFINHSRIDELHAGGVGVYVYTVNSEHDFALVRTCGADGVFSDVPDEALRFYGKTAF